MERLKSRKFWIAVSMAVALVVAGRIGEAVQVIMVYLAAQGVADAAVAFKK